MIEKGKLKYRVSLVLAVLIILEFILAGFFSIPFFGEFVSGGTGGNVTVTTYLEVGAVYPEILNISLNYDSDITLTANSTTRVDCAALVRDYNNDTDITYASAELFDASNSSYGAADDNNDHYSNYSCSINYNYTSPPLSWSSDDNYTAIINCTFDLEYYSNPSTWTCRMEINDSTNRSDTLSANQSVLELLALGLPDSINYGIVNSTEVSDEQITNVTNVGNVATDLFLSGYAQSEGDGYAMNCTLGDNTAFNVYYEKYNVTSSTAGALSLTEFEATYVNLTSSPSMNQFNLNYKDDDIINGEINATYWRIYVPRDVAGTCSGNIVFGAVKDA
ncbi:MAG: hypothetical protein PVJ67_05810 [Candidatus Pacearchaeota archaeon]|jgi:hypothetical protein